ncbi:MAG: alpha/beta hydrolase [Salinivirgaceae bacterium]|nr:alpha/beta hydrolase [Salinivirgaceae bacterium]MDD4747656.1 alpha/beta hydrolase [Salinivirgaceae bacterium]MDY0280890.1 alpha/beta hydrolase [Salinivirgaceae bacterium]
MVNYVTLNQRKVCFWQQNGQDIPLVFLHGYMETHAVFTSFIEQYLPNRNVIAVDIPGHGKSEMLSSTQSMPQIAAQIVALLDVLNIESCSLYGHSMGGFVSQEIARLIPTRINVLGLLHSAVYADTEEKKGNRLREINMINDGKLPLIAFAFMPNVVADCNYERLKPTIDQWIADVETMDPKGIVSCLHAMMGRNDNRSLLNGDVPIHLIYGDMDSFLPLIAVREMEKGTAVKHLSLMENCGHASFIECPAALAKAILSI